MAKFASILISADMSDIKIAALAASTAAAAISIGKNRVFVINADQDITIAFGSSGVGAPDATFYRIPANQQTTFDMGQTFTYIRVFNLSSTTAANIWIKLLTTI